MTKRIVGASLFLSLLASSASAAVVLYEPFNYTAGQGLSGVNGQAYTAGLTPPPQSGAGSPFGQQAPNTNYWMSTGWSGIGANYAQANDAVTNATDLTYLNLVHTASGSTQLGGLGYSPRIAFTPFNNASDGSAVDVFYSLILRVTDLTGTHVNGGLVAAFNNIRGSQSGNPGTAGAALYARPSGGGFQLGILEQGVDGSQATYDSTVHALNSNVFVVGKYTIRGTGNVGGTLPPGGVATGDDTAQIWINPISLGGAEPGGAIVGLNNRVDVPTNGGDGNRTIQSLILRQSGTVSGSATNSAVGSLLIDELRVGGTYADVTPVAASVPEPTTMLVWGTIGALVFWVRGLFSDRPPRQFAI